MPKDKKDELRDKLDSERGTKEAVASLMKTCMTGGGTMTSCKKEMEGKLKNMMGGKNVTKGELENKMRQAGKAAAGDKLQECIDGAADAAAKKACFKGADAMKAFADAAGLDSKSIREADLKKAFADKAKTDVKDTVKNCVEAATDAATKQACFKTSDLKDKIAGARGKSADQIKDSDIREFAMKGARDDVLGVMKTCDKKTEAAKCKELAKQMKAAAEGRDASEISDNDLRRDARDALKGSVAEQMEACFKAATTTQEKMACKDEVKAAMKNADVDGKEPPKSKVEDMLCDAAKKSAGDMMRNCASDKSRTACKDQAKSSIAAVLGKDVSKITTRDVEKFAKDGAVADAKDKALACIKAKKQDPDATCGNLHDEVKAGLRKGTAASASKQKTAESKTNLNVVAQLKKDNLKTCIESHDTKEKVQACLMEFKTQDDDVAKEFLKGKGDMATDKALFARKKQSQEKAKKDFIGEALKACIEAGTSKEDCMKEVKAKAELAGVTEDVKDVLKKHRADAVSEVAELCEAAEKKACMDAAKASMVESGMKPREWYQVKKASESMGPADALATCLQGGATLTECEAIAKEEFEKVSGTMLDLSGSKGKKVMDKLKKLAKAIEDGGNIVIRKMAQLAIDAITNSKACENGVGGALVKKIKNITLPNTIKKKLSGVKEKACRVADNKTEYTAQVGVEGFDETEIDAASDTINTGIEGADLSPNMTGGMRRLYAEMRRLAQVSEVYTAQEEEACADTDPNCGQTDKDFCTDNCPVVVVATTTSTTTTITTTTTTTAAATTTTTVAGGSGGGSTGGSTGGDTGGSTGGSTGGGGSSTTTTTTTMAATTTTTDDHDHDHDHDHGKKTAKAFNSKVVVSVADADAFLADKPKAEAVMKDAIAASNKDITKDIVTITKLEKKMRRLGEYTAALRRLAAGDINCEFTVTFPTTYTGAGLTKAADFDTTAMTNAITNNAHGINVTVTKVAPEAPTCKSGCSATTGAGGTTSDVAGAGNMRSGVSAIMMLFTLGFALMQ